MIRDMNKARLRGILHPLWRFRKVCLLFHKAARRAIRSPRPSEALGQGAQHTKRRSSFLQAHGTAVVNGPNPTFATVPCHPAAFSRAAFPKRRSNIDRSAPLRRTKHQLASKPPTAAFSASRGSHNRGSVGFPTSPPFYSGGCEMG